MCQLENRKEYNSNKQLVYLIIAGVIIFIICMILVLFGAIFYMIDYIQNRSSESVPNFGTELESESVIESVPNFGTKVKISNLEEFATPLLKDKDTLLEVKLSEYVTDNNLSQTEGMIIHVMIPEENVNQLYFFCRLSSEEIVLLVFDRQTNTVTAARCDYSEEEILNEVWEGIAPSDRDIQE